jgi:hypothetical protein
VALSQGAAIQLLKRQIKVEKSSFGHPMVLDKDYDGVSVHAEGQVSLSPPSLVALPPPSLFQQLSPLKPNTLHLSSKPKTLNLKRGCGVYAFNP